MDDQGLKRFQKQNVDFGFSPDVMPSSLGVRRAAPAVMNLVDQAPATASSGPPRRFPAKNPNFKPFVPSRPQGPPTRGGPRGEDLGPKDLGTIKNDYAQGGDGTVVREAPTYRSVNVAGGVDRGELMRRMEMASTSMRGSPSARAAVMGVYAEQLKAMDAAELQKNQGNVDTDQLAFKTNAAANMQEAEGRQSFGNQMGVLNRKAEIDAAAAAAAADPEMRALKMREIQSQIDERAANTAAKADAADNADAASTWKLVDAQLGPNAAPEQRQALYDSLRRLAGKKNADTDIARIEADKIALNTAANKPSNFGGWFEAAASADPEADINMFTATGGNFPEGVTPADLKFTPENTGFWNAAIRLSEPSNWNKTPDVTVNFGKGLTRRFKPDDPELKMLQSIQAAENARLKRYGETPTK